jgi:hypothetical protein
MALIAKTFTAPAHWASALINGDRSGMTDEDERELDEYLEANPEHGLPVSCSDYPEFEFWGECFAVQTLTETLEYTYLANED